MSQESSRFELRAIFVLSFGGAGGAKNFIAVIGRVQVDKAASLLAERLNMICFYL